MIRIRTLVLVAVSLFVTPLLAQIRTRINIDNPSFDLEGYKIAVNELMKRDPAKDDPVNWLHNSYTYFANLHDFFPPDKTSGCIHGFEVFLPWHRELLYRYEMAIRAAKPPRTDNLTIPYWNWTAPPSGRYYPKAYEDRDSILFNASRFEPPTDNYTNKGDLVQKMLQDNRQWLAFAGAPCSVFPPSQCVGGDCSNCTKKKFGALESPFHNNMHSWLGPPMWDPQSAVEDPIFWSFHAFIDVIYQQWQCMHTAEVPNCPNCNFRGMTDRKVRDVIDIELQLGYRYDIIPPCRPAPPPPAFVFAQATAPPAGRETAERTDPLIDPERTIALSRASAARESAMPTGLGPYVFDIQLPEPTFEAADIRLDGLPTSTEFSYNGNVFLYPPNVKLAPADAEFVSRYAVGQVSVWESAENEATQTGHAGHAGHASHDDGAAVDIDVTPDLRYLARVNRGATWKLAVVFNPPVSVDEGLTAAQAAQQITIGSASIVLNDDED